jgi:hypothetical protein
VTDIPESPAVELARREQEVAVSMVVDLIERMQRAHDLLLDEAKEILDDPQHLGDEDGTRHRRLKAKATGVALALSYARESLRMAE